MPRTCFLICVLPEPEPASSCGKRFKRSERRFVGPGRLPVTPPFENAARSRNSVYAAHQLGAGITLPALVLWAVSKLPLEHRKRDMGVWTAAFSLGQFTSPLFVTTGRAATGRLLAAYVLFGICALAGATAALTISLRRAPA